MKKKHDDLKGKWAKELPKALWAYRMMSRTNMGETPLSMRYDIEAILLVEIETSTLWVVAYDENVNVEAMNIELDLLEEIRLDLQL